MMLGQDVGSSFNVTFRTKTRKLDVCNIRVDSSVLSLMDALDNNTEFVSHIALGNGVGSGILTSPEKTFKSGVGLRGELTRVAYDLRAYQDLLAAEGDTITDGVLSNKLKYTFTVPAGQITELFTEAALFGGTDAANVAGGKMVAWVVFPVFDNQTDPEDIEIEWQVNFGNTEAAT